MKWILIIVLISVIMLIARALSQQYSDKYDFYNNLYQFLNKFKLNISFKQAKIMDFLNEIHAKKHFNLFIDGYKAYLKTADLNLSKITILDAEEHKELEDIVVNIGKLNAQGEINQIDGYILAIKSRLDAAEQNKHKICPMIIKLSLLFAIGVAILLI